MPGSAFSPSTTPGIERPVTKAGKFADAVEALGTWKVKRGRHGDTLRVVDCTRPYERWEFAWSLGDNGQWRLKAGHRWVGPQAEPEPWTNLTAALRLMANPPLILLDGELWSLPFDPTTVRPGDVLPFVVGKLIRWRNGVSGRLQEGIVRAKIEISGRTLSFTDDEGYHAVRIDNIREVL